MKHQLEFSFEIGKATQDIEELQEVLCDIIHSVVQSFGAKIAEQESDYSYLIIQAPNRLSLFRLALKLKEFFIAHMQFWDRQYRSISGRHTHLTSDYVFCCYRIEKNKIESLTIMRDSQAIKEAKASTRGNTSHTL